MAFGDSDAAVSEKHRNSFEWDTRG